MPVVLTYATGEPQQAYIAKADSADPNSGTAVSNTTIYLGGPYGHVESEPYPFPVPYFPSVGSEHQTLAGYYAPGQLLRLDQGATNGSIKIHIPKMLPLKVAAPGGCWYASYEGIDALYQDWSQGARAEVLVNNGLNLYRCKWKDFHAFPFRWRNLHDPISYSCDMEFFIIKKIS